jgi:hypothetical protein
MCLSFVGSNCFEAIISHTKSDLVSSALRKEPLATAWLYWFSKLNFRMSGKNR